MVNFLKLFIFLSIFFLPSFVFAEEIIYIEQTEYNSTSNGFLCQSFTPVATSSEITSISLYVGGISSEVVVNFCQGDMPTNVLDLSSGTYPNRRLNCENGGDIEISYNELNFNTGSTSISEMEIKNFNINSFTVETGNNYYFCINSIDETLQINTNEDDNNPYAGGRRTNNANDDLYFILYEEITGESEWTEEYFTLNDTRSDFYSPIEDVCFINKDCYITLYYNDLAIGKEIYFIDQNAESNFPEYADFSFTIPATYNNEYLFTPDTATTTGEQEYCLYLEDEIYGDVLKCGMTIYWYDEDIYLNDIITNTYCSEEIVCADVATSSDFLYGFNCGFRRSICWAFAPSEKSVSTLKSTINKFQSSFPFNIPFGLINSIDDNINSASTTSGASFGLPMVASTTGELYMVNGIDENSFQEVFGASTSSMLETYADYIIYFFISLAIAFIIYRYAIL